MAGRIQNADGSATVLSQYTYTYDAGNRLATEVLGGSTTTYTYDVRSQLTGDTTASYGYDNAGNRNNNSQTIGTGNRLSADVNWTYNYDDEGNLTSKVSVGSPTVTWTYTWDVNNRLTAIDKSAGGNSLYNISYKYDVFGNRIEQGEDTDGAGSGASNVTTRFAWEGAKVAQNAWGQRQMAVGMENWNIWADLDGSNNLKVRYVRGDEVDQLFARVKADGTVASYLTDRMGSVRQMVDAGGMLKDTISYDGFGNVIAETDAAFGDRWKWTGREANSYTGLQYNRARYFNGEIGRWVSEDPIRFSSDDFNYYRYTLNNAINMIDPSGHIMSFPQILDRDPKPKMPIKPPRIAKINAAASPASDRQRDIDNERKWEEDMRKYKIELDAWEKRQQKKGKPGNATDTSEIEKWLKNTEPSIDGPRIQPKPIDPLYRLITQSVLNPPFKP